ncbi:MAG: SbcC/MukB-like Walker B domain-containing protein [Firmicutes bacterium]|mgnify:CR=1 FL=1|nr:SbcC/MukB-like Walker B domain-containing protein [Bacillota bacterium]MDY5771316.1 SbcC/MukB-like Walker B domain-containing protein [Anaerovoracaceae bacterium]
MSKIVLRRIRLINWYGFINEEIPLSEDLTLITGENESGKSTILDAIKYAYTGDTKFNEATSRYNTGIGRRNLISYTRCLLDPSAGIYARPADKTPTVYTHIALEYYDEVNQRPFVLGVVIETAPSEIRGSGWYAADNKTLKDLKFTYEEKGTLKPYDPSDFQKNNGLKLKQKKEGIVLFMQMTGLKLPYQEVANYQRKLRNIMAYNPAAKIQEFIKESVLEDHPVKFDKLKEAKKNIEQINLSLEQINKEIKDLDEILQFYAEYDRMEARIIADDIKLKYKELLNWQEKLNAAEETIRKNGLICEELEEKIGRENADIKEMDTRYTEVKNAMVSMDVSRTIDASMKKIEDIKEQLKKLRKEAETLEAFQRKMEEVSDILSGSKEDNLIDRERLEGLSDATVEAADKQIFLAHLKKSLSSERDHVRDELTLLKPELERIAGECRKQTDIIEACNKNQPDFSFAKEQKALAGEINREFAAQGIDQEARLACEYVIGITDEEWRNAIEAFLGIHRYAVIVPPEVFHIANEVMDKSGHRYVELVNTKRLMARKIECEEDSICNYLEIQNPYAKAYFKFWMGRIHAVPLENVPDFDNAMSKEGKLSRNMAVTYINFKKIRSYCLGAEAIALNKVSAEKCLRGLEKEEAGLLVKQKELQDKSDMLRDAIESFREYNLNAHREAELKTTELMEEKRHYKELVEAQKNNAEFMALSQEVSRLGRELESRKDRKNGMDRQKARLEGDTEAKERDVAEFRMKEKVVQADLDRKRMMHSSVFEKAISEYKKYICGEKKDGGLLQPSTRERNARRINELRSLIVGSQQSYNNRKQDVDRLPVGMECESSYQKRKNKIWIDDLQGIQEKLREQTHTYENIFKHEFVLGIYENAKEARADIHEINKELRKLRFSTRYQFDVRMLTDNSDYAKILKYAEYLKTSNDLFDDQVSMEAAGHGIYEKDEIEKRENEIKSIINKIIDKNDVGEIKRFADYRNYMSYEIIVNNEEIKDGKLSKTVGYNSGAGTQIPYTLILSAALSMLYNARVNSVRLIFIDEPFEKMSDHNIKLMLDFFKAQDFQVVFCAPPNKLESIGSECGVIIPVLKRSKQDMRIGQVRFHE